MGIERTAAYWPTQWPQFLVGKHIEVNKSTDHYAFTKLTLQGCLSTVTAAAGVIAFASEGVNLVIDGVSYCVSFPVKYITESEAPDSFYHTLSSRPTLSDRIERIVSQALGALVSSLQTFLLLAMREDWSTQLHQHLGNYKTPDPQPSIKSAHLKPGAQEERKEEAVASPDEQPSAGASPPPPPPGPPSSSASSKAPTAPPSASSLTESAPTAPEAAHAETAKPAAKKKKRVVIVSQAPTTVSPLQQQQAAADKGGLSEPLAADNASAETGNSALLVQIRAKKEEQAAKGEDVAKKLAEADARATVKKEERAEVASLKQAFAKIKARRVASVHFKGYDDKHGNLANGKLSLRALIRAFQLPFPTDFEGTLGEYVLQEFEKQSLPIEPLATCEILDQDWGTAVRLTITKIEQDPSTGKNIVLEVGLSWQDSK